MNEDTPSPIDRLIDRERIRGASRMIPEGTDASAVSAEQQQQLRNDVEIFVRAHKIKHSQIAAAVGYSHSVISEWLRAKYTGDNGQVTLDVQNWLIEEEQRRQRPSTTTFVWTNVARQIESVVNYCLDYRKIGLIYGPDTSGIGKTMSLQAIHQQLGPRRSSLATIDKVDSSVTGLLYKLCRATDTCTLGNNKAKFAKLERALRGRSHVLLIDQVHNLRHAKDDKPFYILADLFDATNSAQVWCGTADLVSYLNRQRQKTHDESLAQIRRRIFPCVDLMQMLTTGGPDGKGQPLASIDQVRQMFAKNKLKLAPAALKLAFLLINTPDSGGIGLVTQLVEYATMLGDLSRGPAAIDEPLLRAAMRHGMTTVRADQLITDVEQAAQRLLVTA